MSNHRTFYRRAAILIQRKGWCQGHYTMHGAICTEQAVAMAMGIQHRQLPNQVFEELFAASVGNDKSHRTLAEKREAFYRWHDATHRTIDEIIEMLVTLGAEPDVMEEHEIDLPDVAPASQPPRRKRTIRRHGRQPSKAVTMASATC